MKIHLDTGVYYDGTGRAVACCQTSMPQDRTTDDFRKVTCGGCMLTSQFKSEVKARRKRPQERPRDVENRVSGALLGMRIHLGVKRALDECESCCLDDPDDRDKVENAVLRAIAEAFEVVDTD